MDYPADRAQQPRGQTSSRSNQPAQHKKRKLHFPTTYTILLSLTVLVAILTWIVPAGVYQKDEQGKPIAGSYHVVQHHSQGISAILMSIVNGMYGLKTEGRTSEQTTISVNNTIGSLFGSINVAFYVLVLGGFIQMAFESGAIAAGIGGILHRFRKQGPLLITILMVAFGIGGTTFGMSEATLGFFVIVNAIMIALGYDAMVGFATVTLGAGLGVLAGITNPFATEIASSLVGISTGDGIALRLLMWLVMMVVGTFFIVHYAKRVKAHPEQSVVAAQREEHRQKFLGQKSQNLPELTGRRKAVLAVFLFVFLIMIYSVVPWKDFGIMFWPTLNWSFGEFGALFTVGAIVIGIIAGFPEQKLFDTFIAGMSGFMGAALVVALSRGITVVMENGLITDTILHACEVLVKGTGSFLFADLIYLINLPLAFLIPSTSGLATLTMPILGPLADFAHVPRSIVVTAYQAGSGTINLFTPTSAVVMGGLAMSDIRYDRWIRFLAPFLGIVIVICLLMIGISAVIHS